jgi:cytochrome c peroxidase
MKRSKLLPAISFLAVCFAIIVFSCKDPKTTEEQPTAIIGTHTYIFPTSNPYFKFPTIMNIPADNPTTIEGVKLGRYLFYDGRMSGRFDPDSQMSCGTCHIQKNSFECGINHTKYIGGRTFGVTGIPTPHVMLPHVNLVYNCNGYEWNGFITNINTALGNPDWNVPERPDYNFRNLEAEFWTVLYLPNEVNSDSTRCIAALKFIKYPNYPELFKAAFGTADITIDRCSKAVAQFLRTLISYNSKFDKYIRHEAGGNLSVSEMRGYQLFSTETGDCFHCHGNYPLLSNYQYYNNGKDSVFSTDAANDSRYGFSKDPMDIGAYKAPTLRNIELTAPYMHDGRFKTLEEVVNQYASGVVMSTTIHPLMKWAKFGGNQLTQQQKDDLIAFLKTLTDNQFTSDTAFARPSDLP